MAKVSGPLMSMDASGKFGGALVFSKWKGRNVVRQLVIPGNPNSAGQEAARNRTRVTGALQSWVNSTTMTAAGQTLTDKARIKAVTPGGFAWNGFLTQTLIGSGGLTSYRLSVMSTKLKKAVVQARPSPMVKYSLSCNTV